MFLYKTGDFGVLGIREFYPTPCKSDAECKNGALECYKCVKGMCICHNNKYEKLNFINSAKIDCDAECQSPDDCDGCCGPFLGADCIQQKCTCV